MFFSVQKEMLDKYESISKSISGDLLQSDQIKCEILNFIK